MFKSELLNGDVEKLKACPFLSICARKTCDCPSDTFLKINNFFCKYAKNFDTIIKNNKEIAMKNKIKDIKTAGEYREIADGLKEKLNMLSEENSNFLLRTVNDVILRDIEEDCNKTSFKINITPLLSAYKTNAVMTLLKEKLSELGIKLDVLNERCVGGEHSLIVSI